MLKTPHGSGAAEARLHFVVTHHDIVFAAESFQFLCVVHRQEIGAAALIGLRHHTRDIRWLHPFFVEGLQEKIERSVLILVAVRKRHLHERTVAINHPLLLLLAPPGELGAHRTPVKGMVKTHEILFAGAVFFQGIGL